MNANKVITDKEFNTIRKFLEQNFGIHLHEKKKTFVNSRLNSVLIDLDIDNFTDYYNYLIHDKTGEAIKVFANKITTNHTFFMREAKHFDYMKNKVFPELKEKYKDEKDVRIWCAGCSSGEEAYTLQFILQDFFGENSDWNIDIIATDISSVALEKATLGIYRKEELEDVPAIWIEKYFDDFQGGYKIVKESVKKKILFRKLNLMDENFGFKKKMQIISCRNVMIYFEKDVSENLIKKFYNNTEKDGYLFIGHSESLNNLSTQYKYLSAAVYQKQ